MTRRQREKADVHLHPHPSRALERSPTRLSWWLGLGNGSENLAPHRSSNPGPSSPQQFVMPTEPSLPIEGTDFSEKVRKIVLQCFCRFGSALPHSAAHLVQTRPVLQIMSLTLRNKRPVSLIIISNSMHYTPPDTQAMFLKYSTLRFFFNLLLRPYCHLQKYFNVYTPMVTIRTTRFIT